MRANGSGLRVIGAGLPRTGTASLKEAFEVLGFGPCHHMHEVIVHPEEVPTWRRAARGERIDWVAFMKPWGACVDFPSALYYRELMEAFPDAKVVLSVREPDAWYDSMRATVVAALTRWPNRWVIPLLPYISGALRVMSVTAFHREVFMRFDDKARAISRFHAHVAEVERAVPRDRLLVFRATDGWGPLCAFLGVPVPSSEYPRVNDAAVFKKRVLAMTVVSWVLPSLPFALAAIVAALFA